MATSLPRLLELGLPVVQRVPVGLVKARGCLVGTAAAAANNAAACKGAAKVEAAAFAPADSSRPAAALAPCAPREMAPANALAPAAAAALVAAAGGDKTRTLWLDDTYSFSGAARLVAAEALDGKLKVVLDQTLFHPQGGGQPTDVGRIIADGLPPLDVVMVSLDKASGLVHHECSGDSASWSAAAPGTPVTLSVDEVVRRRSARLHSAGHLIDAAVSSAGYAWVPAKGYHFPDGAYVEYVMTAEQKAAVNKDDAVKQIDAALQELLAKPTPVKVALKDGVRTVEIEKTACPCGGTHVKHTSELGAVTVKALKAKGTNMRVSYVVA